MSNGVDVYESTVPDEELLQGEAASTPDVEAGSGSRLADELSQLFGDRSSRAANASQSTGGLLEILESVAARITAAAAPHVPEAVADKLEEWALPIVLAAIAAAAVLIIGALACSRFACV
jgi:hypothetical protein